MRKSVFFVALLAGLFACYNVFFKKVNMASFVKIEEKKTLDKYLNKKITGNVNKATPAASGKCSLTIPDSIKKNVPEDMQYTVMLQLVLNLIKSEYVLDLPECELTEKTISGLLSSLDIHSNYLDKKAMSAFKNQIEGEFGGIGIELIIDEGMIRIISPIDDTPAYKAGIKSGDLIMYIDNECVNGIKASDALEKLRGKPKTKVKLKIKRENKDPFDVEIERDIIKIQSVKAEIFDNIGYIRISTFDKNTSKDLKKFLKEDKNKKIRGIILDLRNNAGGLLDESVEVADTFLNEEKTIVSIRGRVKENTKMFKSTGKDITDGLPLVILINNGTASAPEILAGALRDNKRALLIGTRSFGKGSVQKVFPLSEDSAIKLTIAKYYTPNGESIQANGISPDIEAPAAVIKKDERIFIIREEFFNNALDADKKAKNKLDSDEINRKALDLLGKKKEKVDEDEDVELLHRKMPLSERVKHDYQLEKAFDAIRTIEKFQSLIKKEEITNKKSSNGGKNEKK